MSADGFKLAGSSWTSTGAQSFRGIVDESWYQGRAIYGGLLTGALATASQAVVDDAQRRARSLTVQFFSPAQAGELNIEVHGLRKGNYVSHVATRLTQEDRTIAFCVASFGVDREHPLSFSNMQRPEAPPIESVPLVKVPVAPVFTQHLDLRFCLGVPFSGSKSPRVGGWCRMKEPRALDLGTLCVLLDAWPPPALAMLDAPVPGATIDLTFHILSALPPPGSSPEDAYLFDSDSPLIDSGYAEQHGTLWTKDGLPVARTRQLSAIF